MTSACGRKGPPLPPLSRVPEAVSQIQARRVGSDVYVTLVLPAQNIDGSRPATLSRVDVFAVTIDGPPPLDGFERIAERIASVPVAPPPEPDAPEGAPAAEPAQGATITIRETLGPAQLEPKVVERSVPARQRPGASPPVPAAKEDAQPADDKAPGKPAAVPTRYYMALAVSDRSRDTARGALASVAVAPPPDAPAGLAISYTEESIVVSWSASPGASAYNVYRDDEPSSSQPTSSPPWAAAAPVPLNATSLPVPGFSEAVEFGRRRCYQVRAVRAEEGSAVEGPPSRECVTPEDRWPPAPPKDLQAVTSADGITLRWAPNSDKDLGGYLILRGRAGDATLAQITPMPLAQTQYLDRNVTAGMRYVYAVVAVDRKQPVPNRSEPSDRDEATAP